MQTKRKLTLHKETIAQLKKPHEKQTPTKYIVCATGGDCCKAGSSK